MLAMVGLGRVRTPKPGAIEHHCTAPGAHCATPAGLFASARISPCRPPDTSTEPLAVIRLLLMVLARQALRVALTSCTVKLPLLTSTSQLACISRKSLA